MASAPETPYLRRCTSTVSASWTTLVGSGRSEPCRPAGSPDPSHRSKEHWTAVPHAGVQADVLGHQARRQAVRVNQRRHPPAGCDQEREQQSRPLGRRPVGAGTTYEVEQVGQAGPVEAIAVTPHREVVTEPPAELVGVGMTADPEHQVRVVHARPLTGVQVEPVRQQAPRSVQSPARARRAARDPGRSRSTKPRGPPPSVAQRACSQHPTPAWPQCATRLAAQTGKPGPRRTSPAHSPYWSRAVPALPHAAEGALIGAYPTRGSWPDRSALMAAVWVVKPSRRG